MGIKSGQETKGSKMTNLKYYNKAGEVYFSLYEKVALCIGDFY